MNKTKPSLLFFICSCLLFILAEQSCVHKEDNGTSGTRLEECTPTRDSLLQWYRFKTGTYWIYEDGATGLLDSCRVNYCLDTVYANGLYEFQMNVLSYLDNVGTIYYCQSIDEYTSFINPPCKIMPIWVERIVPGISITETKGFFYPLNSFEYLNHSFYMGNGFVYGRTSILNNYVNYSLLGRIYKNVVRVRITGDLQNEGRETIYDFAKNIGIIHKSQKMTDSTWREWNLVRFAIYQ